MKKYITLQNLSFSFNKEKNILNNFSLCIDKGDVVALIGSTGSGKSTLISIIAGYLRDYSGEIYINGKIQNGPSRNIVLINQENDLFEWLTVFENMAIVNDKIDENLINDYLKIVNLYNSKNLFPGQLSGGMKKKLSLARGLSINPDFIILDEAFSSLDMNIKYLLYVDFIKIIKSKNKTVLIITHDIDEALELSDKIIIIKENPMQIKEILNRSDSGFNRNYILNILRKI